MGYMMADCMYVGSKEIEGWGGGGGGRTGLEGGLGGEHPLLRCVCINSYSKRHLSNTSGLEGPNKLSNGITSSIRLV